MVDSTNISVLSKISVQLFEQLYGTQFRAIPTATALLQTKQFAHIPPIIMNFLCLLSTSPKAGPTGLKLGAEDSNRFQTLAQGHNKFNAALTLSRKRGQKQGAAADEDEDEGEAKKNGLFRRPGTV